MTVIDEIAAERRRQVEAEGWTNEHDDEHESGQMALAAACYAAPHAFPGMVVAHHWTDASRYMDAESEPVGEVVVPNAWPWDGQWFKLTNTRRDLIKAAALIVAEIERIDRATLSREP